MRADELKELIDKRPFSRLRLHMTNGETVDITHPDAAIVSKSVVLVGLGVNSRGIADRTTWYNLLHIVKAERLDNGNGEHRRQAPRRRGPK